MADVEYKFIDNTVLADEVIGHANISSISDGTLRGAVKKINTDLDGVKEHLQSVTSSDIAGGKNLFKRVPNHYVSSTGFVKDEANTIGCNEDLIPCSEGDVFTFSCSSTVEKRIGFFNESKAFISRTDAIRTQDYTFTIPSGTSYFFACIYYSSSVNIDSMNIQLEKGSTSSDYEPYIKSAKQLTDDVDGINSSLRDLEFLGWEVPSEMAIQNYVDSQGNFHQKVGRVDLGSLTYTLTNESWFSAQIIDKKIGSQYTYCSKYRLGEVENIGNKEMYAGTSSNWIAIRDDSYSSVSAFQNANKNTYLYYELGTENVIKAGNEVFGNAKSFYFNANTDATVDSNRLNAIKSVINSLDMKNQTNAMGVIRYYDGLYHVTNIIKSSNDIIMAFEFSHKSSKIIYWNISTERVIFEK